MSGPLLTQPLNIDGQGVVGEGQDRYLNCYLLNISWHDS